MACWHSVPASVAMPQSLPSLHCRTKEVVTKHKETMMARQTTWWIDRDRLERWLWRVEGWIDRSPRLSRWYTDWLLPRLVK